MNVGNVDQGVRAISASQAERTQEVARYSFSVVR